MDKVKLCAVGIANLLICAGILVWFQITTVATTPSIIILISCMIGTCGLLFVTYKAGDKLLAVGSALVIAAASGSAWYYIPVPAMGSLSLTSTLIAFVVLCTVISSPQASKQASNT